MKKNKLFFGILGILVCMLGAPSCAPDYETEFEVKTLTVPDRDLSPINFGIEGGSKEVGVETNVNVENWTVTSNADWCNVQKLSDKVVVSAAANNLFVTRIARVTVAYGHQSYDIPVSQTGNASSLLIEGKKEGILKEMPVSGGEVSINVSSNMTLDYISIPDTTGWVTWLSTTGTGTEKTITFKVDPSFDSSIRYSTIMLQSSQNPAQIATFVIKQDKFELVELPLRADMLETNAQEVYEGPIANLLDNNSGTFFHSAWSYSISEAHYIQVNLDAPIRLFKFWYQNRNNSNGKAIDVTILLSDDGTNWIDFTHITSGLPTGAGSVYESTLFQPEATFKHFRFVVNKTNSGTAPTFFNMAEFRMYVPK